MGGINLSLHDPDDLHSHYSLLPSYTDEEMNDVILKLSNERPKLASLITGINSLVLGKTKNILGDEEESTSFIRILFDAFVDRVFIAHKEIDENKDGNVGYDNLVKYINIFFELLRVKKFYNTIPVESFSDFNEKDLNEQIINIVLPKGTSSILHLKATGGSCHNWSILFHDFFEKVGFDSEIIFLNPISNHSFVKVKIGTKYYIMDPLYKLGKDSLCEIEIGSRIRVGSDELGIIRTLDKFKFDAVSDDGKDDYVKNNVKPIVIYDNKEFWG